ncbi:hypothetical protein MWG46_21375 [Escherichia coli]|nr:hypothetical protein [Escherichia coli]
MLSGRAAASLCATPMVRRSILSLRCEDINELKRTEQVNQQLMERITLANEAGGIGIWEWELSRIF